MVQADSGKMRKTSSIKRWIVLGNLIALGVLGFAFTREYLRNADIEREIARWESENARLEGDRLAALDLISELSSEYYVEGEGRSKFGLGRPGETLVVVQDGASEVQLEPQAAVVVDSGYSNPERWFLYFFDRERLMAAEDVYEAN
ncbi:septum formation initiator family protein [Patescibacteria group bacterium]|jgi:cell division protein FtsB|nr:septum formation initiator family protein [Patescibacteria group bacterium]